MNKQASDALTDSAVTALLDWMMDRPYQNIRHCVAVLLRRRHNALNYVIRQTTGLSNAEIEEWDKVLESEGIDGLMKESNPQQHDLWKTVEPSNSSDATPHELFKIANDGAGWLTAGVSIRGLSHAHEGRYRDDDFNFYTNNHGWHFVAVADGAGSAHLSRVGARIAVQTALQSLAITVGELEKNETSTGIDEQKLKQGMADALLHAAAAVQVEARQRELEPQEMNTTLLLLCHCALSDTHILATAQVGDGLIASVSGMDITPLATSMEGRQAGETYFLSHLARGLDPMECVQIHRKESFELLLVMTDGVSDDFFPPEKTMHKLVRPLYQQEMYNAGKPLWLDLIRYRRRGSSDDRTLVVLFSPEVQEH
jgi:hypothetical protein